ncbi:MAG: RNA polymerase sigma factor [Acidobacteria bacterium]|nr:RNA polymerase sigma factor [Acidobacteriota bacterium]
MFERLMDATDEELFRRMKSGDRVALERLYERREPGLFRYALHVSGDRTIAEETTHEAFLALLQPGVRFDPERGCLEGYLYGMVRNLVRVAMRTRPAEPSREPATDSGVLHGLIGDERAEALHHAIRELPAAYRDAVILCDLEERSYEDAAKAMECPVGTVRSRLHRARSMLAAKLQGLRMAAAGEVR